MIPNPFTRPINVWITVLVVVSHGLTAWAMMSIDSPDRPNIKVIEPESIQLELVTLVASPAKKPRIQPKSEPQLKPQPEKKAAEPVEKVKPAPVPVEQPEPVVPLKPVKPLKPEPKKEQPDPIKETPKSEEEIKPSVSVQKLIIEESEKITKATVETEQDLSAMIRAVTKQFNRDQARQRQSAREQANRELAEQDRLQGQAEKQKAGKAKQTPLDKEATAKEDTASDEPVVFSAEQASWLQGHEPTTSVPLQVWRNITARSGDVFTVLLELHVDKDGYITEVQLLRSSGNQIIDAIATIQVRAGQLNPFQQEGMPVNGIVTMPLSYERP